MNQENNKKSDSWNEEEMNNVVGLFDLLLKIDKRNNPDLYKLPKGIILDKDGNQIKL
jgi:hypothetical protein